MKANKLYFPLMAAALVSFSACIEETFPESSTVTTEQVSASPSAIKASVLGLPSAMQQGYFVYGSQTHETDMAYPQYMIAQTELLGDMYPGGSNSGYDWYRNYNTFDRNFGDNSYFAFLPWFTGYKFIKADNDIIAAVDVEDESLSDELRYYGAVAHACRAFNYYMLTVFYQPVENIYTDCSSVKNLTVCKVTETTSRDEAKANPRMTIEEDFEFIMEDLTKAMKTMESMSDKLPKLSLGGTVPSLAVVYGIAAKVCMWFEDYANAYEYATKAINASGCTPITRAQWDDPTTGFCKANQAWMWYIHYDAENMGNLCNFTGWMSGEADWGYSSLTMPMIDASLYNKMGENDFRQTTFVNSDKHKLSEYKTSRDLDWLSNQPNYLALKFRCVEGDWKTYSVGGACDVPVMRIEEMQLLQIEAKALRDKNYSTGASELAAWVTAYRDPGYTCSASDERSFELAMLDQLRIEFWGEGNAFQRAKKIKPDVVQNYEGTNAPADIFKINCKGIKPNWNLVIPIDEVQSNQLLETTNNPDPSSCVPVASRPTPVGEFAQK